MSSVPEHINIAKRWAFHRIQPALSPAPYTGNKCRRMIAQGDVLYSWGTHFPLIRLIRGRGGKPVSFLLNGDTWSGSGGWAASSGNVTSNHQREVLRMAEDFARNLGMPYVTVPQSVLDAAGIDSDTVTPVHRTADWYEDRTEEFEAEPPGSRWAYEEETIEGTALFVNRRTGETFTPGYQTDSYTSWRSDPPGKPKYGDFMHAPFSDKVARDAEYEQFEAATRRWEHEWEKIPGRTKRNGRRTLYLGNHELEQYVRDDGTIGSRYHWQRHWLGESLIKAKVPYAADVRCLACKGTGSQPHAEALPGAEGPLTELQDRIWHRMESHQEVGTLSPRLSIGSRIEERCSVCLGRKRVRATRMRTAYFLSGFDHNEPQPSYFFTELPPDARPKTIAEAYEALKPATVRLAEEMGRTVLRQGDQFFIEMPGLTLRELKQKGGVHHRRGGPGRERQQWVSESRPVWATPPRFQRYINENCWLNGTTHEATEVVNLGTTQFARGIVRHVPDGRTPDHVRLRLGDGKTFWLNVPNRTPVGR